MSLYWRYNAGAIAYTSHLFDPAHVELARTMQWYQSEGRQLFIDAFKHEAGFSLPSRWSPAALVRAAIPKSFPDLQKKTNNDAFFLAHATWFIHEMDLVTKHLVVTTEAEAEQRYYPIRDYVRNLLGDSIILFEHWGHMSKGVPGTFGGIKNTVEHVFTMYHGARQLIYGSNTPGGLGPSNSYSDLAISIIRQTVELRIRRAFGVLGKTMRADGAFKPIGLSDLLDVIGEVRRNERIEMSVPFDNLMRINSWANLYLHTGLKLYSWCPGRVIDSLREFCIGGPAPGYALTVDGGVSVTPAAFAAVQSAMVLRHDQGQYQVELLKLEHCSVMTI